MSNRTIKIATLDNNKCPFVKWLNSLDKPVKARVQSRLIRLLENNFGDFKKLIMRSLN